MPTEAADVRALLGDLVEAARGLAEVLDAAAAVQWSPALAPRPRVDTTERSKGGPPSDPTADLVLDERRLAVRSAVESGARSLRLAIASLHAAHDAVEAALDRWEGA